MSEARYVVTLKGLVGEEVFDKIQLCAFRLGKNAVLLKDGGSFVEIEFVKHKRSKNGRKDKMSKVRRRDTK